jgi:hypothetical protein
VRKAFTTVLLSAAALAAGFAGAVAPAAATEPTSAPDAPPADCIPADDAEFTRGGWSRAEPGVLATTLKGEPGHVLCEDVSLSVSWYALAPAWNGSFDFSKADSTPQTLIAHGDDVVFEKGDPVGTERGTDVTDQLPLCDPYQIDLYTGDKIETVDAGGHSGFLAGGIVAAAYGPDDAECQEPTPSTTEPSTEPSTPTEPGTTEPTEPTETEPTETEPSEPTEPSETDTTPATTATSGTTTVAGTSTAPSTSQGPELAFTGASGTGALAGLAGLLVVGGAVALILINRRRRGATHQG